MSTNDAIVPARILSRRQVLVGFGGLGVAALLAACGGGPATVTSPPAASSAPAGGGASASAAPSSAAVPSAAPSTAAGAAAKKGGNLILGASADAETLDPHATTALRASRYLAMMHDNLLTRDFDGSFKPGLAESYTVSPDGLTYTFKLRSGVKFHSGKAFSSADVKYTFDRWLKNEKSPTRYTIQPITSVEAPDPQTVVMKLDKPYNILLDQIAGAWAVILNGEAVDKAGANYGVTTVDGTGPYKFKEWVRQQRFVVERNPDYAWGSPVFQNTGAPYLDSVEVRIIPEDNTRIAEFEAGTIHLLVDTPPQEVERLSAGEKVGVVKYDQLQTTYFGLNTKKGPVDDVQVRRAIGHAINRDEIVKGAFFGLGEAAVNMLAPKTPGNWVGVKDLAATFNLDKAKATLETAGWKAGAGGIREKGGQQLVVPFWYINDSATTLMAQILQEQLAKAGIKLDAKPYEETAWFAAARTGDQVGFTVGVFYENADVLRFYFYSKQQPAPNRFGYAIPELDALMEDTLTNTDKAAVTKDYEAIQKALAEQAPALPLIHQQGVLGASKQVRGIKVHPSRWLYRLQDLSLA